MVAGEVYHETLQPGRQFDLFAKMVHAKRVRRGPGASDPARRPKIGEQGRIEGRIVLGGREQANHSIKKYKKHIKTNVFGNKNDER